MFTISTRLFATVRISSVIVLAATLIVFPGCYSDSKPEKSSTATSGNSSAAEKPADNTNAKRVNTGKPKRNKIRSFGGDQESPGRTMSDGD